MVDASDERWCAVQEVGVGVRGRDHLETRPPRELKA